LSETRTVNVYWPIWDVVGVHAMTPEIALMDAPLGAPTKLNLKVFIGMSKSEAVAVKLVLVLV
jgi:hypothetical protein